MASLYIKDSETAALAAEVASLRGVSKTAAVRDALRVARVTATPADATPEVIEKLLQHWRDHPLPPPTGLKADKAFFDAMWGED